MNCAVVLVNRTLRVHDHPALAEAAQHSASVVPLFVVDDAIVGSTFLSPNRGAFLAEALADLRRSMQSRGADLVIRRGDPATETVRVARDVGADRIYATADVSGFAQRRQDRLGRASAEAGIELVVRAGVSVVEPGVVLPTGRGDHFKVFTPYHRAWSRQRWRAVAPLPDRLRLPDEVQPGALPTARELTCGETSPQRPRGGETVGRELVSRWLDGKLTDYDHQSDILADEGTSRLSPYLHFGCLSALELATAASQQPGGEAFVRQLCWRDFYHQVVAAFPHIALRDYRSRGREWSDDPQGFEAWAEGRTGYPLVDAGMRQLRVEGWMHNRGRLVTASFLTKDLGVDWRQGAQHFLRWLVDGDVAQNSANWQWVAGTGNDTRPNRVLNPVRQAERFDADGRYVRRWVPELSELDDRALRRPWTLGADFLKEVGYPAPLVDHDEASQAFRSHSGKGRDGSTPGR